MDIRARRRKERRQPRLADKHTKCKYWIKVAAPVALFLALTIAATWPLILHPFTSIYSPTDHVSTDCYGVLAQLARGITTQGASWYYHHPNIDAEFGSKVWGDSPVYIDQMKFGVLGWFTFGVMFLSLYCVMEFDHITNDTVDKTDRSIEAVGFSFFELFLAMVMGALLWVFVIFIRGIFYWLGWKEEVEKEDTFADGLMFVGIVCSVIVVEIGYGPFSGEAIMMAYFVAVWVAWIIVVGLAGYGICKYYRPYR